MSATDGFAGTYVRQAATYDSTRSAGAETLGPLLEAIDHLRSGARVLDVGGGTGNYAVAMAARGLAVTVVDRSREMLALAVRKGLRIARADATQLPFDDASVHAVTMISMLHQVPDWPSALREARRVLAPEGVLVLLLYTSEHVEGHFLIDYFPMSRAWIGAAHVPLAQYQSALPGSHARSLQIRGTDDLTLQVMRRHPRLALDEELARQTSFFARLETEDPTGLALGRERLERDLAADALPENYARDLPQGDAVLLVWKNQGRA